VPGSSTPAAAPAITVVIPTRDRPLHLRWLLNALAEQTLDPESFEVIVCHDSRGPDTGELLRTHPLAAAGKLRELSLPAGTLRAGAKRNRGWRAARAPVIAFTDDDCRPPPEWLQRALAAALAEPGAIVQGATKPDPDELQIALRAPRARTQDIDPPSVWAQTCNILYPRQLLERLGGFAELVDSGEDTDLALRGIEAGARFSAAPDVLTYHAVHDGGLAGLLRTLPRWEPIPWLVGRHPRLRRECAARLFWRESHGWMLLAIAGLPARRLGRARLLRAAPWAVRAGHDYGGGVRGRVRATLELPGQALIDLVEIAVLARGSLRYRALVL
jgi:hypothetical protein